MRLPQAGVEGDEVHAEAVGQGRQIGVGHLTVTDDGRHIGLRVRHRISDELVLVTAVQAA